MHTKWFICEASWKLEPQGSTLKKYQVEISFLNYRFKHHNVVFIIPAIIELFWRFSIVLQYKEGLYSEKVIYY